MKMPATVPLLVALMLAAPWSASARAETPAEAAARELDITMTVAEDGAPDDVVQRIALPPGASPQGALASDGGRGIASGAAPAGRELSGTVADQARAIGDSARELGAEGAASVRDAVKDAIGNGEARDIPGEVRDNLPPAVRDTLPEALPLPTPVEPGLP